MIDYTIKAISCEARKMPKWCMTIPTVDMQVFLTFIKSRMPKCKIDIEHKALHVTYEKKYYRIMSGQYFCFLGNGERTVINPSAFRDLFETDSAP